MLLLKPLFTLCSRETKWTQINYNFLTITEVVGHKQAHCFSNKVRGWETVSISKGAQWGKGFQMEGQGERKKKTFKVCEKQTPWGDAWMKGKVKTQIWKLAYESSCPNHPNHYVVTHCAAMIYSHLLEMADRWHLLFLKLNYLSPSNHTLTSLYDTFIRLATCHFCLCVCVWGELCVH